MLGKTHTNETKKHLAKKSFEMWMDPSSRVNSDEYRQKLSDKAMKQSNFRLADQKKPIYSRTRNGHITIGGKTFFVRSSWEANTAAYFQFLKDRKEIVEWDYEPTTFWFENIKRGVRSYKPDFLITRTDGTKYYEEIKGWMDAKSKTKLKRMKKYYPSIEIRLLDQNRYNEIKKMAPFIPYWGLLDKK